MTSVLKPLLTSLACTLTATAATAEPVNSCDWQAQARNLVEPWDVYSRTFANGEVRLALLDTVEPAAAAYHLLVLSPPYDELGDRQCRVVSMLDGQGFSYIEFETLDAAYDPSIGLIFTFEASRYAPEDGTSQPITLEVTLNQATGAIGVWHQ